MSGKYFLVALALALSFGAAPGWAREPGRYDERYFARDYGRGVFDGSSIRLQGHGRLLSAQEIAQRLQGMGYAKIRDIRLARRQGHYFATALDGLGSTFRLTVSPYSGRVIGRRYLRGPQEREYDGYYYDRYY